MSKKIEGTPEEEPADDLNAALAAAYDEVEASAEEPDADEQADSDEQVEDADPDAEEASPDDADAAATPGDDESGEEDSAEEAPLEPHATWDEGDKERFAALPSEAQEMLLDHEKRREADYTRKTQEIADQRKRYEALDPVLDPIRQEAAKTGATEAQAVAYLFGAHQALQSNPREALKRIAHGYGIEDLSFGDPAAPQSDFADPLQTEVADLKAKVQGFETETQRQQQAAVQEKMQATQGLIDSFAAETDESGASKYPHFEAVRPAMAGLFNAGRAESLEQAYEMAIWADPTVRPELLAQAKKAEAAEREETRKSSVAKARKGGRNVKARAAPVTRREDMSLKDELGATWDDMAGAS